MVSLVRTAHLAAVWLFVVCSVIQIFLAGLGVFENAGRFATHRDFGYTFGLLVLVIPILAIVARLGRRQIGMAALLLVLFLLQSVFVALRDSAPAIAALHPLNGFLILGLSIAMGREAWAIRNAGAPVSARQASGSLTR